MSNDDANQQYLQMIQSIRASANTPSQSNSQIQSVPQAAAPSDLRTVIKRANNDLRIFNDSAELLNVHKRDGNKSLNE